ncbi:cyclophilin-like fold protein [uncultured Allofournierella sp.]|uniref:cyclophilin-like fold protein n=1 Tax=uncultured Allofournierella sp. TaxID=1940258 RepID=UPI0025CF1B86|nr:cyclophilin-like fold protein [uncultured Fournierella sp.]
MKRCSEGTRRKVLAAAALCVLLCSCAQFAPAVNVESEPAAQSAQSQPEPAPTPKPVESETQEETTKMNLQIGDTTLTATLADNSSARALAELLKKGPLTLSLEDYAGMEKVGPLGTALPQNNEQMVTGPGDIILYQGSSFVIYYGTNSWRLTRLGRIDDTDEERLRELLGDGAVTVTLSLETAEAR